MFEPQKIYLCYQCYVWVINQACLTLPPANLKVIFQCHGHRNCRHILRLITMLMTFPDCFNQPLYTLLICGCLFFCCAFLLCIIVIWAIIIFWLPLKCTGREFLAPTAPHSFTIVGCPRMRQHFACHANVSCQISLLRILSYRKYSFLAVYIHIYEIYIDRCTVCHNLHINHYIFSTLLCTSCVRVKPRCTSTVHLQEVCLPQPTDPCNNSFLQENLPIWPQWFVNRWFWSENMYT